MTTRVTISRPLILLGVATCCALLPSGLQAQTAIKTDASWGRTAQTVGASASATSFVANSGATVPVPGNLYTIPQSLGRAAGANLFHSFDSFRVGTGDAAVFTTTSSFNNVISRVSGASATTINGVLALQSAAGSKPNFFFINPNGVAFGAGAQLDMPGAFHVSTANQLRFADDIIFKAGAGADSTLTIAPPTAFGFLGSTRAPIAVSDGAILANTGQPINVAAGDVTIDRGLLFTQGGGDLRVAAVGADAVEVPIIGALPAAHGTLLVLNGASILAVSRGAQNSGNVAVSAGNVLLDSQSGGTNLARIGTAAGAGTTGNAGDVSVTAQGILLLFDGGQISSLTQTTGNAGSLNVHAGRMAIDNFGSPVLTGLGSSAVAGSAGNAGSVKLHVDADLTIRDGGIIVNDMAGRGNGGRVQITAGSMLIDGQASNSFGGILTLSRGGFGRAGDIDIATSGDLSVLSGGQIISTTFAAGPAGSVKVSAGSMTLDGRAARSPASSVRRIPILR